MSKFTIDDKAGWKWTVLIAQPELVTDELVQRAVTRAAAKRPLPAVGRVRLERFREGLAAQLLHRRPYSAEGPTIARLHRFIDQQRLVRRGKHHEIYLTDPSRTTPERLKTVIRQPVADEGPTGPMNLGPTAHGRGRRGVGSSLRRTAGTRQARPTGNGKRMSWLDPTAMGTRRTEATRSTCHPSYLVGYPDLGAPAPPRSVG